MYPTMSSRLWTRDAIINAIKAEAVLGHDLSYSQTAKRVPSLLRAAERGFGRWSSAVEAAGIDYESVRKYRQWTKKRVIERIREWHEKGEDLSWRNVSTNLDPPLAAAVQHGNRFASWNDALKAAGLNPEQIAKYRRWDIPLIQRELETLSERGVSLDQATLEREASALRAAIYRKGGGLVEQRVKLELRLQMADRPDEIMAQTLKPQSRFAKRAQKILIGA